ncbi:phage tail protein, partial [Pseudomonas sp. MWU12-2020]|uniref:phage tail protein n=1 Tax=Pseudomonas sp. MWU12-2020 TaxID=2928856 RepID=UPI001FFF0C9D
NSNAVIGTGTAFIANARVGDALRGPDGGWYEVTNIASDTALSIEPKYQGATNASGIYALAPMQGYVKDSADALRALVNQFGGVLAVLGNTPTVSGVREALGLTDQNIRQMPLTGLVTTDPSTVVPTDTIVAAFGKLQTQLFSKAGKGANNDITSLSGLTTALSVSQGGTGAKTQSDARTGLGLKTAAVADVIGTMSGGAIIEDISNANGSCVRFANGFQVCTLRRFVTVSFTDALAAMFSHPGELFLPAAYPAPFVGVPSIGRP